MANPILGVGFHWLGGLASASFYIPYKGVKRWAWETYWLVGGFFSWIIAPWCLALILVPHLGAVLHDTPLRTVGWAYFWGAMWGLGGLTFGLTMRYLGISLGMAVALGLCAAFGTLMPPIFDGSIVQKLHTHSGVLILVGVAVCLLGIAISGLAGMSKERESTTAEKQQAIQEFNFAKGVAVAVFSGIMSASFAYGLSAAEPMTAIASRHGAATLWTGLPKLVIVLLGGFTTNLLWCAYLNVKNGTGDQYFNARTPGSSPPRRDPETIIEPATDAPGEQMAVMMKSRGVATRAAESDHRSATARTPMLLNYSLCAVAGVTWYLQFFFYTMGETQMGQYKFSSWTLHVASIIIFSTLWGIALHEWRGSSTRTQLLLGVGLFVLIGSTLVIGYGNYLGATH